MPTAQSSDTQKQLIEKILRGQRHAGSGVWHQGGVASKRTEEQTAEITNAIAISSRFNIQAIRNSAAGLIKEEDKDDERDAQDEELERKRREENEREKKQGGFFAGLGGLLKTIAMGKDGKGEAGWFKGGLFGFGKGMFRGIGKVFSILWSVLKWIGGPLLLMGALAFLTADEKTQQEMIKGITAGLEKVWNWLQYLAGAFKEGFMGNMEGEDGLKKKWAEFQTAWKLAVNSFDDIKFGKNAEGQPYTGLAGIAEWLGDISAQIAGLFIDLGTGVANLIADPNAFIGRLQGRIQVLFDELGNLISDFWHDGIANPRTWRKLVMDFAGGGRQGRALAATLGLGLEGIQESERIKRDDLVERTRGMGAQIELFEKQSLNEKDFSATQRRWMASEAIRMKAEEKRNKEKIENLDILTNMDNAEILLAKQYEEFFKETGIDIEETKEKLVDAKKSQEAFRGRGAKASPGQLLDMKELAVPLAVLDSLGIVDVFGQKFTDVKGGKEPMDVNVQRGVLEDLLGEEKSEGKNLTQLLNLALITLRRQAKKSPGTAAKTARQILDTESLLGSEPTLNESMKQLENVIKRSSKQDAAIETQTKDASQLLQEHLRLMDADAARKMLKLMQVTNPELEGLPRYKSSSTRNAEEGTGAVVYNMGGNVTDQSKKSVFMFPERHIFGEQRMQLVTG